VGALRYRLQDRITRLRTKYLLDVIFVHINKTGGSSIEAALKLPFQHRTALELREQLGPRRWSERFSFAFVRNPWDKVASHYFYRVKTNQTGLGAKRVSFDEWVTRAYGERDPAWYDQPRMFMAQVDWITDRNGVVLVDYIGRFERLAQDFATVCQRIGRSAVLPHLKRTSERDYRALYSTETAAIISARFAADIDRFGYSFEDGPATRGATEADQRHTGRSGALS
jgi:chondroitin 4-sulfotransferase 11